VEGEYQQRRREIDYHRIFVSIYSLSSMPQLIAVGHKTKRRRVLVRQLAYGWMGNTNSGEELSNGLVNTNIGGSWNTGSGEKMTNVIKKR